MRLLLATLRNEDFGLLTYAGKVISLETANPRRTIKH